MVRVESALRLLVVVALLGAIAVVRYLDRDERGWVARLQERFLFGVPWGTLVAIGFVLIVYGLIQGGLGSPHDPLTIPFVSWSYLYPLGLVTAPFAHSGFGHLLGNVIGALLLGPIVEYAWGHYPQRRGSFAFDGLRRNPYIRAFVLFPLGVVIVGLATAAFHWGPLIGFSGVVYAFAGFGVVRYPITTVVLLAARGVVSTVFDAIRDPLLISSPGPSFGGPWWAGIAVQGHLLGLLLGAIGGVVLYRVRNQSGPTAGRLWIGAMLMGFSLSLWAVWWYGEGTNVILYRGLGVVLVVTLATLLATAVRGSGRDLVPATGSLQRVELGISRRRTATIILVLAVSVMAAIAVPVNLTTVETNDPAQGGVDVRDYSITYGESVRNQNVPAVDIQLFGASTNVTTSGIIVASERRHLWTRAVSASQLAFTGTVAVDVGGLGWHETVLVQRNGWIPVGGDAVYRVSIQPPNGEFRPVFGTEASMADPVIAGRNVSVGFINETFALAVSQNESILETGRLPARNESVTLGGITLRHVENRIVAVVNGTRVTVVEREEYE